MKFPAFSSTPLVAGLSNLFVATRGTASDGHQFIPMAIQKGATAILCEQLPQELNPEVTYIQVKDSADALGLVASCWLWISLLSKLILVGVTGTNGKTTIATLLYKLFRELGYDAGLLSTVCNYVNDDAVEATHTTPDALELNALLARMVEAALQICIYGSEFTRSGAKTHCFWA